MFLAIEWKKYKWITVQALLTLPSPSVIINHSSSAGFSHITLAQTLRDVFYQKLVFLRFIYDDKFHNKWSRAHYTEIFLILLDSESFGINWMGLRHRLRRAVSSKMQRRPGWSLWNMTVGRVTFGLVLQLVLCSGLPPVVRIGN